MADENNTNVNAQGSMKKGIRKGLKNKLKKKAIKKIVLMLLPTVAPIVAVVVVVVLVYGGIQQAMSMIDWPWALSENFWETCTDEKLYKELNGINVWGYSRISEDALNDMMISRTALSKILEEVIDYNKGTYFGDYAKVNLEVEGDDRYTWFDLDKRIEYMEVPCSSDTPGATACVAGPGGYVYTVWANATFSLTDKGFVPDPNGTYYMAANGQYVNGNNLSWTVTEEIEIKTNKKVVETGKKKKMDFDITNKWMYLEFPMDWEYVYLFAVYHFIDKNNMTYINIDDTVSGESVVTTITYDELYKLIEAFRPEFKFATLPSAKNPEEGNQSNVFEALIKYNGKWKDFQKWRDTWKEGKKFKYKGKDYYTNEEIKSMYKNTNPYGEVLMDGEPQKVIWYWSDYKIRQYDENGEKVKDPVIHRTELYFPISILEEVKTVVARYDYSGSYTHEVMYEDATEIDINKYRISWAGISGDDHFFDPKTEKTTTSALKNKLANMITGRDIVPSSSVFDHERMDKNIFEYADERNWELISMALNEMPQGKDIGAAVEAAYLCEGIDIETARQNYNSGRVKNIDGNVEYGTGGLRTRGVVYEGYEQGMRELYGVSDDTRLKHTGQGRFIE